MAVRTGSRIYDDTGMFPKATRASHEASTVFSDIETENVLLARIRQKKNARLSKVLLLREVCEAQLADLQKLKQMESESLSDNDVQISGVSLSEVHRRCESAQTRLVELSSEVQRQHERIAELVRDRDQLISAKKQLTSDADLSRKAIVDLYRLTTRVRWDFDTEPNKVIGFVAEADHVEAFEFDKTEKSMFFITNKIWGMMAPSRHKKA